MRSITKYFSYRLLVIIALFNFSCSSCSKKSATPADVIPPVTDTSSTRAGDVEYWITNGDRSALLSKQTDLLVFGNVNSNAALLSVDSTVSFQEVDGFGFTLTQGSAQVINAMSAYQRNILLTELFGSAHNSISISYLRLGIGATDLSATVFSYDDMPAGQTDPTLANFSIAADSQVVRLLKEILLINPGIQVMATPWSPPVWMKDNNSSIGGNLLPAYYNAYAQYFVKYIQAMSAEGITVHAVTPQNEPLNPANNPSLSMTASQQADFIGHHLGPAFANAGIQTRIIAYDHNCDRPDYPLAVLGDATANPFVYGSAFHLYGGDISALTQVHNSHPAKHIYFTEQYTASSGSFGGDFSWHLKNVIIGSMRNWSRTALEWNLANDPSYGPHTPGGCTTCLGALTVSSSGGVTRNVGYYIVAQASKFISPGSKRIQSDNNGNLHTAAFLRPDGKKVVIVFNESTSTQSFRIGFKGKWFFTGLNGGSAGTFIW